MKDKLLNIVDEKLMWSHVEFLNKLHRVSGTKQDFEAVEYIRTKLEEYNVENEVLSFDAYISHPKAASIEKINQDGRKEDILCKTRAFSATTPPKGLLGELVYVPTKVPGSGITDGLVEGETADSDYDDIDVNGKIVLCERGGPDGIKEAQDNGAIGFIHMWASEEDVIHEMIVSPIWGTPTPKDKKELIVIPVVCIKNKDGIKLKEECKRKSVKVILKTETDTRWMELRLPVATIKGQEEPEKYILIAGHLDSWHEGITDNATGNASCLELARIFKTMEGKLKRSVKIAWWCGHSYGRYSGSTWFADRYWRDLEKNCLAYINVDSPGCKGATNYLEMTGMAEVQEIVARAVVENTGQKTTVVRPTRCADQSFNGIGISSLYLLMGYLEKEEQSSVGGSAGGWWWHSEEDTIDKADSKILVQDTKIYASSAYDIIQEKILPFKISSMIDDIIVALEKYSSVAGEMFDLSDIFEVAKALYEKVIEFEKEMDKKDKKCVNKTLMKVVKLLNSVIYASVDRFHQEPAEPTPIVPGLYDMVKLKKIKKRPDDFGFCLTELTRQKNRLIYTMERAEEEILKCL